ncbi:protein TIC 21, chloroplastic [Heracleum sosnowskyi]|uniref:Protein TIC 21, chloroplastic n=1 Tax=Heracleum sosnowskyi TaxID=360622 RepID=A0AAD8H3H3_9APIA|nr:protein TIC 21, chloroplastic [Heracleum sosnowskyi]
MQTLLLPEFRSVCIPTVFPAKPSSQSKPISSFRQSISLKPHFSFSSFPPKNQSLCKFTLNHKKILPGVGPISAVYAPPSNDDSEDAKLAQVARRLQETARYFKRLGSLGFWGQLVCTIVSAVVLSFSIVVTGKITSPATFYATAGGIAAAFISVFWSYGYIRLSDKLQKTANSPSKAPPRSDVVQSLKNGIVVNLLGMGAAILGMQATVGWLMAKSLTTSSNPFYQGISPGSSPVLALDVFLVQASANTILSHFLGLVCSLELLRTVTLPPSKSIPIARVA